MLKKIIFLILPTTLFTLNSFSLTPIKPNDPIPANAFVELAKAVNPAVVNISTSAIPKSRRYQRDPMFDMLEQFYGMRMGPRGPAPAPQDPVQTALGTGFIIREDGLIVTNNHVIAGADIIKVQLSEGEKSYEAKLIGSDERTDLALIKINVDFKLTALKLGSSKDLQVGEWVAAFGNPFGQGHTMTKGIISAKGRDLNEINKFPLLQTDTPINPGNSGGPLVNLQGEVIGVNSAIDARAQGIGFAIPIDEAKSIIPQLEKNGKIKKGFLGVALADIDGNAAYHLGLKDAEGAILAQVERNSPAEAGGLKPYDVVKEFNGRKIRFAAELSNAVADAPLGQAVKVKVIREGKEKTLEVTVTARNEKPIRKEVKSDESPIAGEPAAHGLGFKIADLNKEARKAFNISPELKDGAVVTDVTGEIALRPGDVIVDVNRKEVNSAKDVNKQLKKGANTVRIIRGDRTIILVVQ